MAAYNAKSIVQEGTNGARVRAWTQAQIRRNPARAQTTCTLHKLLQALEEKPQLLLGRLIGKRGGHIPQR